jgi:hypothetical protein
MRTFTMQGVAPDPNWQRRVQGHPLIEPEPVFQLTRELHRYSIPTFAVRESRPGALGFSTGRSVPEKRRLTTKKVDELTVRDPFGVRASWRPVVIRIAGLLALAAALVGAVVIFGHPIARRQALSWVTLGYTAEVLRAVQ